MYTNIDFAPGYPALAVITGNPAAAYASANPSDIQYVRSGDQDGASWGIPEIANDYSDIAMPIADINGHPAIAYMRNGIVGVDLMFAIYH